MFSSTRILLILFSAARIAAGAVGDSRAGELQTKPAAPKPASAPAKIPEAPRELDFDQTKKLVGRFRETDHWALKAIILLSLGPKWHPVGAGIVGEALEHKDFRLRAFALETLLRSDLQCLRWGLSQEMISSIIHQHTVNKNLFYGDKLLAVLRAAFPELNGKPTKNWKIANWQYWWGDARGKYAPQPWVAPESRPAQASGDLVQTAAERFVTRAVDLSIAGLDVAICIDSTGSMQPTINAARDGLAEMVALLRGLSPKFRLGLVHYKDLGDFKNGARLLSPLTDKIEDVQEMLNKLIAAGGGDIPERVEKGLEIALDPYAMGWTPQANKIVMIIGDAPPHPADIAGAVEMARKAYEKPFGKEPRVPSDLKTDKSANRPFIISTIGINNATDMVQAFKQIAAAGGGMFAMMSIVAGKAGEVPAEATRTIVQHMLTLTFGRQWANEAGVFVTIYQDYHREKFF
ncbi:MAG: VWA domain-containing protein [Planctomycetes bacterium]|nr:VWA domain-containing protein [Planctomycetota bacterium]